MGLERTDVLVSAAGGAGLSCHRAAPEVEEHSDGGGGKGAKHLLYFSL